MNWDNYPDPGNFLSPDVQHQGRSQKPVNAPDAYSEHRSAASGKLWKAENQPRTNNDKMAEEGRERKGKRAGEE